MTDTITVASYKRNQVSEHQLQVLVLSYLITEAAPDIFWFAVPNAGLRSLRMGARMKQEGLRPGISDLCIMLPGGKTAWLEMKTLKGRQSIEQKGFEARCKRLGHAYAVARTFEEAVAFLKRMGALK